MNLQTAAFVHFTCTHVNRTDASRYESAVASFAYEGMFTRELADEAWKEFREQCPYLNRKMKEGAIGVALCHDLPGMSNSDPYYGRAPGHLVILLNVDTMSMREELNRRREESIAQWAADVASKVKTGSEAAGAT